MPKSKRSLSNSLYLESEMWYNNIIGVLAQLIERRIRIAEVAGLSPAYSTITKN